MNISTPRIALVLCAALALLGSGCAAVVIGVAAAGSVAYAKGDLETNLDASIPRTIAAVDNAFTNLRFRKTGQKRIPAAGSRPEVRKLFAEDPQGKRIAVKIKPASPFTTHISIRVAMRGNELRSQAILEEIKRNLY